MKDKKEVKAVILMLWYITRRLDKSYISSKDEYDWLSLKGFYDENLEGAFWQLADETKQYLQKIQQCFEDEVTEIRNKISPPKRGGPKKFSTTAGEDEAVLIEIYENVKKPVIDLNCISDENDREFFKTLESLRDKFKSEEAPEILKVYYLLLSKSGYFDDITKNPSQVENLSMLTQTMSNYEEYISQTDIRGLYFFLTQVIRNYSANYDEPDGVQLMTVHSAKGLEFPVTIVSSLQKDEFPMKVKDEERSKKTIMMKDTFYTPNECLEYKHFTDETGEYRPITVEEENQRELEEEERVIYVAMTRAADLLILSCIGDVPECIENLYPCLTPFTLDVLDNVKICRHFEKEDTEQLILNYSKYTKYCSCPFKYNLGYNLGFSRPGAKAANRGTVFHEIMETVNLKLIEGEKISKNELSGIIQKAYSSMFNIQENPEEYEEFKKNTME